MLYDLTNIVGLQSFKTKVGMLIDNKDKVVELTVKRKRRSLNQNSYLHLILTWFAIEYGDTLEYVKQDIFKKNVNPQIFKSERVNFKTGEVREHWRSSADLNTKEMTVAIERFRNYASKEAGIYLPEANEDKFLQHIEIEASKYENLIYV